MNLRNLKIPHVEKISISYIFFLSTLIVRAQKYKLLTGYVFDSEIPISNIHVINTSRGNAEVTDINGLFEISVSIGEKLVFSSIQYEKYELIITENIFSQIRKVKKFHHTNLRNINHSQDHESRYPIY